MIAIMESHHDNTSPKPTELPLYQQIQKKILSALEGGVWQAGALIPSEMDLAVMFQVSQGTVRKALDELVAQHLLIRRQGIGTFVATHQAEQSKYRFLHLANASGNIEESTIRILLCTHQRAPELVFSQFALQAEDIFVHIRRLMSFNDQPVVLEDIWLPCPQFEELSLTILQSWTGSLYGLFESHFGVHMTHAQESISAVLPSAMALEYLQISPETPLLDVFRIAYTFGEKPVEVRQAQYMTKNHHYLNRLN